MPTKLMKIFHTVWLLPLETKDAARLPSDAKVVYHAPIEAIHSSECQKIYEDKVPKDPISSDMVSSEWLVFCYGIKS